MRKRYFLDPTSLVAIDPAPFGDIGRAIDLRGHFLDPKRPWSPTMLEDAAACPFAFFAKHGLRLAPREEPDYDVTALVLGELAHDILAAFFHADPPHDRQEAVQRMHVIAAQVLSKASRRPGMGHPGFWQVRRAELLRVLEDVAAYAVEQDDSGYRSCYHERELSGVVPCGAWSIWLKGRVDRVTVREGPAGITGVQVQDFKYSGNVERYRGLLKPDALGRSSFQLPTYLYLTLQELARDGHQVADDAKLILEYLLLKDTGRKAWQIEVSRGLFAPDRPEGLLHGLGQVVEQAIAGRFAPRPADAKNTCTYCAYGALCRYWTSGAGLEKSQWVNEEMGR
jgi:ATP-dependent helicase/DNAse subunit B